MRSNLKSRSYGTIFDVSKKKKKIAELENKSAEADFWNDSQKAGKIMQELEDLRSEIGKIDKIEKEFPDQKEVFYAKEADHFHLPPKEDVYTKMEALIFHFKMIMGEIDALPGEVYHSVEGGNGEVGFYLISDGGRTPYRLHFRRPCFIYYQAYPEMVENGLLSDAIITLSSLNVIAGELDA